MTVPEFADALVAAADGLPPVASAAEYLNLLRARLDATAPGWRAVYDPDTGERVARVTLGLDLSDGRHRTVTLHTSPEAAADDGV